MNKTETDNKKRTLLILFVIFVIITIIGYFVFLNKKSDTGSSDNKQTASNLADCTKSKSDSPSKLSSWNTSLYSAENSSMSARDGVLDNGERNFSMAQIAASSNKNNLYFKALKKDGNGGGAKITVEFCNKDNKTISSETTQKTTTTSVSENSPGRFKYFNNGLYYPQMSGEYRVDAFVYVDGVWYFTDRIDKVVLAD